MPQRVVITGNYAAAHAARLARVKVVAAYPITPQTAAIEKLAEFIAKGELDSEYIKVESEHSAMAACIGASALGVRVFTATSSQGLLYMHEMLHWASGSRLPVVMAENVMGCCSAIPGPKRRASRWRTRLRTNSTTPSRR